VSILVLPDATRGDEQGKNENKESKENKKEDEIATYKETYAENDNVVLDDDKDNLDDELNITAQGIVTGCIIYGGQVRTERPRKRRATYAPDAIETEDKDPLQCQTCKKKFSHSTNLKQHICKWIEGQQDLVHFAMSFAYQRIDQHEFEILNTHSLTASMSLESYIPPRIIVVTFKAGRAQLPPHGYLYGRNYIDLFKNNIVALFQAGVINKSARMEAAKMLEKFTQKYPGRLDFPPESEICQAISI
jgi:hypothetical protein